MRMFIENEKDHLVSNMEAVEVNKTLEKDVIPKL
jgi:hypothetical protein